MAFDPHKFPDLIPHPYERVRSEVRTGDLLLCSGTGLFSEIIKAATESEFSHVGFIVRLDVIDRIFVFESVESVGVRASPLSSYINDYLGSGKGYPGRAMIARHVKFDALADPKKFAQFGSDHLNYPFDKDELLRITARLVAAKLGLDQNALKRDKEYICSEYAYETFKTVGIEYQYDPRGFIAPADFVKDPYTFPLAVLEVKP